MKVTKRVIELAKERAISGFSVLARSMLADAEMSLMQPVLTRNAHEEKNVSAARNFLRQDGRVFQRRIEAFFASYLERAMHTMYTDLRMELQNISANTLSLIDDETMTRKIDVDRLVVRMRDGDQMDLGRINLTIANLHGSHEVRERENPFRPYLLARSLYEVLHEMVEDEHLAKVLFDPLSDAMMKLLPPYYAAIREVFESHGVTTQLIARPSALTRGQIHAQREWQGDAHSPVHAHAPSGQNSQLPSNSQLFPDSPFQPNSQFQGAAPNTAFQGGAPTMPNSQFHPDMPMTPQSPFRGYAHQQGNQNFQSRMVPSLARMQEYQRQVNEGNSVLPQQQEEQTAAFQDFVWQIFNQQKHSTVPRTTEAPPDESVPALDLRLKQHQQAAAKMAPGAIEAGGDGNAVETLTQQISREKASKREHFIIEVVALVFEFILQDEMIPAPVRAHLARMHVPFLRASILEQELLHEAVHPARQLLNRFGTIAVGLNSGAPFDADIAGEIGRVISKILEQFDGDMALFVECQDEIDRFLVELFRTTDAHTALYVEAINAAEKDSAVLINTAAMLKELLAPLTLDARVVEFIERTWVHVLVHPASRDALEYAKEKNAPARLHDILPQLLWSVLPMQSANDRSELMRLLPDLAKRLKQGLDMIALPETEARCALDQLVALHMQVMHAPNAASKHLSLDQLREHCSLLAIDEGSAYWLEESKAVDITPTALASALARRGLAATLNVEADTISALAADSNWLTQLRLGACVEIRIDDSFELARLCSISEHHSLYIFMPYPKTTPLIYTPARMLRALRDGVMRPLDDAPLFDRAVESVMAGAESMSAGTA